MEAVHDKIRLENPILSNSKELLQKIYEAAEEYSECDKISKQMNEKRKRIRDTLQEKHGLSSIAFQHEYSYYKMKMHEKDGYDDTRRICHEALASAKNGELFEWMAKPPKEAKPKEPKAKKDKKPVGKAQAEAYIAAHEEAA